MAQIGKILDKGKLIYPITLTRAIVDLVRNKPLTEILSELEASIVNLFTNYQDADRKINQNASAADAAMLRANEAHNGIAGLGDRLTDEISRVDRAISTATGNSAQAVSRITEAERKVQTLSGKIDAFGEEISAMGDEVVAARDAAELSSSHAAASASSAESSAQSADRAHQMAIDAMGSAAESEAHAQHIDQALRELLDSDVAATPEGVVLQVAENTAKIADLEREYVIDEDSWDILTETERQEILATYRNVYVTEVPDSPTVVAQFADGVLAFSSSTTIDGSGVLTLGNECSFDGNGVLTINI